MVSGAYRQFRALNGGESPFGEGNLVVTGNQLRENVDAGTVGCAVVGNPGCGVGGSDVRARHGCSA